MEPPRRMSSILQASLGEEHGPKYGDLGNYRWKWFLPHVEAITRVAVTLMYTW
jgi:hypothetical protein